MNNFSEQVFTLVVPSTSLQICTQTSDTNSAKQLHLSPTFGVFLLFGLCFVCTHKQPLIFCLLLPFLPQQRIEVLSDAVEVRRPRDPGGVSMSLWEGTSRGYRDCSPELERSFHFMDEETETQRGEMACWSDYT